MSHLVQSSAAAKRRASTVPAATRGERLTSEHRRRLLADFHVEGHGDLHQDLGLLRRLWPFLRPHWALMAAAMVMIPISIYAALRQPLATKGAVDGVIAGDKEAWIMAVTTFAAAALVQVVANFIQTYCLQLAGQRSMAGLRERVFAHVQHLSIAYFDRTPVGRVLTRVTNDIDALGELFSSGAAMVVADVLMLFGIVAFMLALDLHLSLVAFAAVPPLWLFVEWIRRRARVAFRDIRARVSQLNAYLSEQVQGVQVVQAFSREAVSAAEYRVINDAYRRANHRAIRYDAMLFSVVEAVASVCIAAVLWWASVRAGLLQSGRASAAYLGTVAAFYQYLHQFFVPIRDLSTKYTLIQSALAAAERIYDFLDQKDLVPQAPRGFVDVNLNYDPLIRFQDVRFGYRDHEEVLHGISFSVQKGEHVAIVGATGAGKSSTIALLLDFYRPKMGRIEVGGADICSLSSDALRRHIALVPQDVFLFSGTVGENVAMGPVQDPASVKTALCRVSAWDLISARGGLGARVAERGANFSAGERQLIAFARALYRDSAILILDEATASIDSETEARLQSAIDALVEDRTAIVIAHRLSTIRKANRILVFHRGYIAEQGTHETLLANDGIYARLYRLQFGGPQ